MEQGIHPNYHEISATCFCGDRFTTEPAMEKGNFIIEICSLCHPFYTSTQRTADTTDCVDKFDSKFGNLFKRG